jgi:hypothetical protein
VRRLPTRCSRRSPRRGSSSPRRHRRHPSRGGSSGGRRPRFAGWGRAFARGGSVQRGSGWSDRRDQPVAGGPRLRRCGYAVLRLTPRVSSQKRGDVVSPRPVFQPGSELLVPLSTIHANE